MGAQNAKADLEQYRLGYPGERDNPRLNDNLHFYKNERPSVPDGDYIDNIHEKWWGKYKLLERHHGYIQWLFPIREEGMNFRSQKLQPHEAEAIKEDPKCMERILKSYELMLDFYGMRLKDRQTGELERTENWEERYDNLNWSSHNYLRITRILKCLGELGLEHLKSNFLQFFIEEVYETKALKNCRSSLGNYWIGTIKDDTERARLEGIIEEKNAQHPEERYNPYSYRRAGGGGVGGGGNSSAWSSAGSNSRWAVSKRLEDSDEEEEEDDDDDDEADINVSDDDDDDEDEENEVKESKQQRKEAGSDYEVESDGAEAGDSSAMLEATPSSLAAREDDTLPQPQPQPEDPVEDSAGDLRNHI
ncbi:Opioid growth factor receptor [Balamuthia mandrillaris]